MSGRHSPATLAKWQRLKMEHSIDVDETAPYFDDWLSVLLAMMRQQESSQLDLTHWDHNLNDQLFDCCIICSEHEEDLKIAREFGRRLNRSGFYACLLHDIEPGCRMQDRTAAVLDGSTVVFMLCTTAMLHDRGLGKMAYQELLSTHLKCFESCGKPIIPLLLPEAPATDGSRLLHQSSDSASNGSLSIVSPPPRDGLSHSLVPGNHSRDRVLLRQKLPFGASLFQPIRLEDPTIYMKQVRRCIPVEAQIRLRLAREEAEARRRLFASRAYHDAQHKTVCEAVKLFQQVKSADLLRQIEVNIASGAASASGERMGNAFNSDSGGLGGILAIAQPPTSQLVNVTDCSHVSIGPTYNYHIQDDPPT